jgi:hypothetical protein
MKKVKLAFITMAILLSIGGAFATRSRVDCRFSPQFYKVNSSYVPAGQEGEDYLCQTGPGVCTYIKVGNNWQACQTGIFVQIPQ